MPVCALRLRLLYANSPASQKAQGAEQICFVDLAQKVSRMLIAFLPALVHAIERESRLISLTYSAKTGIGFKSFKTPAPKLVTHNSSKAAKICIQDNRRVFVIREENMYFQQMVAVA